MISVEYRKRYREINKERISKQRREHYLKNKEQISKRRKEYYQENKEAMKRKDKERYQKNREKIIEKKKEYRLKNLEKVKERKQKFYLKNRKSIREYSKAHWHAIKEKVLAFYGVEGVAKCKRCGIADVDVLSIDHINDDGAEHRRTLGRSISYTWFINNKFPPGFQTLCMNCQFKKRAMKSSCSR